MVLPTISLKARPCVSYKACSFLMRVFKHLFAIMQIIIPAWYTPQKCRKMAANEL